MGTVCVCIRRPDRRLCLPLLDDNPNLAVDHRKFCCAPGPEGWLAEIGMQQFREFGGYALKDFADIFCDEADLGTELPGQLLVLEDQNAETVFFYDTEGVGGVDLVVGDGEFEAIDEAFEASPDVDVEKAG